MKSILTAIKNSIGALAHIAIFMKHFVRLRSYKLAMWVMDYEKAEKK
jgi:hypothetical protein